MKLNNTILTAKNKITKKKINLFYPICLKSIFNYIKSWKFIKKSANHIKIQTLCYTELNSRKTQIPISTNESTSEVEERVVKNIDIQQKGISNL